eukprot:COSAG06_NODE_5156_length_3675_cov_1.665548_5_plen_167_part_00
MSYASGCVRVGVRAYRRCGGFRSRACGLLRLLLIIIIIIIVVGLGRRRCRRRHGRHVALHPRVKLTVTQPPECSLKLARCVHAQHASMYTHHSDAHPNWSRLAVWFSSTCEWHERVAGSSTCGACARNPNGLQTVRPLLLRAVVDPRPAEELCQLPPLLHPTASAY